MEERTARRSRLYRWTLLATLGGFVLACSGSPSGTPLPSVDPAAEACPSTPDELRYGCGLNADGSLTFQPDVVTVGGGAKAIRSLATDGVTWTIDARAPGADAIAEGKVLYVTDAAVGRVLAMKADGPDISVVLGPAELGEIIRDGELRWDEPVSLAEALPFAAPGLPGISTDALSESGLGPQVELAAYRIDTNGRPTLADDEPPVEINLDPDNSVSAFCCTPIIGAVLDLDQGGIRIEGGIWLETEDIGIRGYARFKDGTLVDGLIEVTGVTGIHFEFRTATAPDGPPENFKKLYVIPVEYRAKKKKGQGNVPLVKSAWQSYLIRTAFSAGSTSMNGTGDYELKSPIFAARFKDGDLADVDLPTAFTTKTSLLDSLTGVSVGVNGFVLSWIIEFCMCIGTHVNSNGLYVQFQPAFGVSNDSSAVGVLGGRCRSVTFVASARVGAGHFLPQSWVDEFNTAYGLSGKTAMSAKVGPTQDVPLWDEIASMPEGIRRCT